MLIILVFMGVPKFIPCTPLGCYYMLKKEFTDLSGLNVVIIGRSNIVGKPMAALFLSLDCTVTIAHSKTKNLSDICIKADILVCAIGRPEFITKNFLKNNSIIFDVGINRIEDKIKSNSIKKHRLVGDVLFNDAINVVKKITPVPGGVGPMTIACLMHNTVKAAFINKKLPFKSIIEGI